MSHHDTLPGTKPVESNDWGQGEWDTPALTTPETAIESPRRKTLVKRFAAGVLSKLRRGEAPTAQPSQLESMPGISSFKMEAMRAEEAAAAGLRQAEETSRVQSADMWQTLDAASGEFYGGRDKDTKFSYISQAPPTVDQRTRPNPQRQEHLAQVMKQPEQIWRDSRQRNPGEYNPMLDAIDAYREARTNNLGLANDAEAPQVDSTDW